MEETLSSHPDFGNVRFISTSQTYMLGSLADRDAGKSLTINGMTFSDLAYRVDIRMPSSDRFRIIAKGIGIIYQKNDGSDSRINKHEIIYYRVDGTTGGSLTGTPFATGGDAVGVFFTE